MRNREKAIQLLMMLKITPIGQFLAGPYFKADIPNIRIDYKGLTAYARNKGCKVCDLTDEEKNLFITDADMNIVRECAIKL